MPALYAFDDTCRDRFRTTINVLGDSLGAGLVDHISKDELSGLPKTIPRRIRVDSIGNEIILEQPGASLEMECHTTPI